MLSPACQPPACRCRPLASCIHLSTLLETTGNALKYFGLLERATFEVNELWDTLKSQNESVKLKQQVLNSLKSMLPKALDNKTISENKFSDLEAAAQKISSKYQCCNEREQEAMAKVESLSKPLDEKREELRHLKVRKEEVDNSCAKSRLFETELRNDLARMKKKYQNAEAQRKECEIVLFAIDNNKPYILRPTSLGKASEMLKSEEDRVSISVEIKKQREKMGLVLKEISDSKKISESLGSMIRSLESWIESGMHSLQEAEVILKEVVSEKQMLNKTIENEIISELPKILVECQECLFNSDLKEEEIKLCDQEVELEIMNLEELREKQMQAAKKLNSLLEESEHATIYKKIELELGEVQRSIDEAKSLLVAIDRHLSSQQMDDESWKNHASRNDFKPSGLNVEGSGSKKKMKDIDYLRSSELSCLSENNIVPEDGYFEHGKRIDNASSIINLDKKNGKMTVEDNSFRHMHDIEVHSNRTSEGSSRRHSSTNTSSLPCKEVNTASFMRSKRKRDMSNLCGSSSVASETLRNQSSRLNLSDGRSSISSQNNSYDYDIKFDELQSPELSLDNYLEQNLQFEDYSARVSQIESDELLARKLQEQYNEEVAGTMSTSEIDANIPVSLQETDPHLAASTTRFDQPDNGSTLIKDSHFAASSTRSDMTNNRERSMTDSYASYAQSASHNSLSRSSNRSQHQLSNAWRSSHSSEINFETREKNMSDLHAYYTQLASHNSSSQSSNSSQHQMSNARGSFHCPEIDLETRLLAELKNFASMDSEKKRNLMEALEAAFDQSNSAFDNDDDYDMVMLSLDKNARASEEQIDSLPQSIIQSGKVEETCAICLEVPSFGDKIRHLPCLHEFHLQCIDAWLRRKACCPVCKWKFS